MNICQRRKPSDVSLAFGGAFPQTEMPVEPSIGNCMSVLLCAPEPELWTGTDSQRPEATRSWVLHPEELYFLLQPLL